jgi:transposase-like protein
LFLSIMETVHDFDSVSAAARHYNVNRSSLTRRLEKAQHAAYVKELRSKVESSKNKAIKEEAEEADTDSIDEVLLIR